jgi:hypothetical protein
MLLMCTSLWPLPLAKFKRVTILLFAAPSASLSFIQVEESTDKQMHTSSSMRLP